MSPSRPEPHTTLKPYLTLPQLFSLTWLAYPVLSLLFVAFRLQISSAQAQDAVEDAKGTLLTSCRAAEKAATSAASLPRFLAQGTNQQITDAVNATVNGARAGLVLALTCMQGIIEFVIDIYRSTFLCFLELVVRGSLELLIGASQEATQFVESTLQTIGNGLRDQVAGVNSAINSAIGVINDIGGIFGGDVNIPTVNLNLDALANIQIPNTIANALTQLNSTIPSLDELGEAIDRVIAVPFDQVKKEINDTMLALNFDASVLPVPQTNTVAFCSSLDTSVVDRLGADLVQFTKIAVILIVVVAILLILGNCLLEWYKNRCLLDNFQATREAWLTNPLVVQSGGHIPTVPLTDDNIRELHAAASHPLLMWLANKMAALLRLRPSHVVHTRWFFSYVFHPPAMACFLIGLVGLISVELQLAAIGPLASKYDAEVANTVSDFTVLIGDSINESMRSESAAYAAAVNLQVETIQTTVNDGMFGWIDETTTVLNNTLVTFYDELQRAIETVFGGTPLEGPMQEFIHCLIGTKVEAFENALTFMHDNLQIDLPRANENVLMISESSMTEVAQPISLAAVGDQSSGDNDSGGLVGRLVLRYVAALEKERVMFLMFLGLWGFVVLMAIGIICWHAYAVPAIERRKKTQWEEDARSFQSSPWLATLADEKGNTRAQTPPAVGFSHGHKTAGSLEDASTTESSTHSSSKLVAWGRKFRQGDALVLDTVPTPETQPSLAAADDREGVWARLKAMLRNRQTNEDEPDWIADSPSQSHKRDPSLVKPISPVQYYSEQQRDLPTASTFAGVPRPQQRKLPPPLVPAAPPVTQAGQLRFPMPPRTSPSTVPLHLGFARQLPSDMPRSPLEPALTPAAYVYVGGTGPAPHTRKASIATTRAQNPFLTPHDEREGSPFTHSSDTHDASPFADRALPPVPPLRPTPATNPFSNSYAYGRAV